jgi:hypothetical protein
MLSPFHALVFRPGLDLDAVVCASAEPDGDVSGPGPSARVLMDRNAGPGRYHRARSTLADWIGDGTLRERPDPQLFTYTIETGDGPGLTGLVGLADPGVMLPHEQIDDRRVGERTEHLDATGLQVAPVLAVAELEPFRPGPTTVVAAQVGPAHHRLTEAGTGSAPSTGWMVLADGHHRAAAARRSGQPLLVMLVAIDDPGLLLRAHPGEPAGLVDRQAVVAAALTGVPLPPKSTWFEPKPCAGLVMVRARGWR